MGNQKTDLTEMDLLSTHNFVLIEKYGRLLSDTTHSYMYLETLYALRQIYQTI